MIKNIFICLLFSLLLLSCNNPSDPNEGSIAKYKGTWYTVGTSTEASRLIVTINDDSSVTVHGSSSESSKIPASDVKKNSDNNYSFSTKGDMGATVNITLDFNSDTSGTYSYTLNGGTDSIKIVKK